MRLHTHKQEKSVCTTRLSLLIGIRRFKKAHIFPLLSAFILLMTSGGTLLFQLVAHTNSAFAMAAPHKATVAAPANTAVLTFKNNIERTGLHANETILNTSNVKAATFGKRVTYPVQGQVYAQPLFVPNLTINGVSHNVVIVATEHDQVYAFDADTTTTTAPLWETNYLTNGATSVAYTDVSCNDTVPEIGITGTPSIDLSINTMYLVTFTKESGNLIYRLHAVDITTGLDKPGSPTVITGSVTGTGNGASNGVIHFLPVHQRERAALTVVNGQIYVAFGSFCDDDPYHGWVFGYTYDNTSFKQQEIYNDSSNGAGAGIWGSGGAIAADTQGNLYASTGNGDVDLATGGEDAGDSVIQLSPQLKLTDYFTPFNAACLKYRDADISSGGPMLVPSRNELFMGGKEGRFYVLNTYKLGNFTADPNLNCDTNEPHRNDIDRVIQEFLPGTVGGAYGNPAYYTGPNGEYIYFSGAGSPTRAFQLQPSGTLSTTATSQTSENFGFTGGNPSISANGTQAGTGIAWIIDPAGATLRAYTADNLGTELYNSNQNAARDALDSYVKFSSATIANGEVFVGTTDTLTIFGLHPTAPSPTSGSLAATPPPLTYNNRGVSSDSAPETGDFDGNNDSYSVQALQNVGINPGDNAFFKPNKMVFSWPNVLPGSNNNYIADGQTIPVTPMAHANLLGFLGAATNGPSFGIASINYTDGSQQYFMLGFSDWSLNGGDFSQLYPGNAIQSQMTYYNSGQGTNYANTYLFYTDIALQSSKDVASVTLPSSVNQGQLHVFAISTLNVPQSAISNTGG
ncbi:hypothetical protein ccbrp13_30350 [Ktedonobacteria bacterium brp13]|nr:hypothetical protein ccbrp13_30350 [Ktedonobacteria bacterium brp13]